MKAAKYRLFPFLKNTKPITLAITIKNPIELGLTVHDGKIYKLKSYTLKLCNIYAQLHDVTGTKSIAHLYLMYLHHQTNHGAYLLLAF